MNSCACGCGAEVRNKWARGHSARGEGGYAATDRPTPPEPDPVLDYEPGPVLPDPPPAHGRREWRKGKGGPRPPRAKPSKVTAGIRNDIDAKISFALEIPARVWEARDPVCGGTFVEQRPEISAALTEIVCQSPDLIAWFAGGGGQFMLYLFLAGGHRRDGPPRVPLDRGRGAGSRAGRDPVRGMTGWVPAVLTWIAAVLIWIPVIVTLILRRRDAA
jgi:hypothetical protein